MNTIEGMKCPECGHTESFHIHAPIPFLSQIMPDSVESHCGDWTPESPCECGNCNFPGRVADFRVDGAQEEPAKHTPGDWKHVGESGGVRYIMAGEVCLATVHDTLDGIDNEARAAESYANGDLFAAAPDLLEACRDAITAMGCVHGEDCGKGWADCDCWMCETTRKVDAAIAKAEGRTTT